jgi:hypothetical protein
MLKEANEILNVLFLRAGIRENIPKLKITKVGGGLKRVNKETITISSSYLVDEYTVLQALRDCVATYQKYFCNKEEC